MGMCSDVLTNGHLDNVKVPEKKEILACQCHIIGCESVLSLHVMCHVPRLFGEF